MTRRTRTSTLAVALSALVLGACNYDRAPVRATAATWDTGDDDDRRITEWEGQSTREVSSPFEEGALASTAGGPGVDVEEQEPVATAPDEREREVVSVDVEIEPEEAEEPGTTAQASEAPAADDEAPLLEEAAPEPARVANPALAEIAQDDPPAQPLIADGFLRDEACPMELEGTRVSLVQRQEGPALVFKSADPNDVEELQSRVMSMALTKDDERVEESATGTRAAASEDIEPQVQPPAETEMQEGGEGDMPFDLPTELSDAEQEEASQPVVSEESFAPLPEAEVTVELTDDGAHVLFEPRTRGQRDALTQRLTTRAQALREGDCPADTMSMLTPPGEQ